METPGLFQTIAEIGVAIAGFSGLIVSLRKDVGPLRGVQKYRLKLLLFLSLGAMFLSLLPELLLVVGLEGQHMWRWCSSATLLYSAGFSSWWIIASLRVYKIEPEIINWFAFGIMSLGHLLVFLLLIAGMFGWIPISLGAVFTIALCWYLFHAAHQFIRMLFIPTRSDLEHAGHGQ